MTEVQQVWPSLANLSARALPMKLSRSKGQARHLKVTHLALLRGHPESKLQRLWIGAPLA